MRPVKRGDSPNGGAYDPYRNAWVPLINRIGSYCSYCERKVEVSLAVEHIQPKGLAAYAHLKTTWSNFLLGCTNCNSTKGDQDVVFNDILLPDRDNTFLAYDYEADGSLRVAAGLAQPLRAQAAELLRLTGLDRTVTAILDDNEIQVVVDRVSKRINVFGRAREVLAKLEKRPDDIDFIETIVMLAAAEGCFSIWMKVFEDHPEVCRQLIDVHHGTRQSGCFDPVTQAPISPHPNNDHFTPGGRI